MSSAGAEIAAGEDKACLGRDDWLDPVGIWDRGKGSYDGNGEWSGDA